MAIPLSKKLGSLFCATTVVFISLPCWIESVDSDDCRTIEFRERKANKALIKQVIRSELVLREDDCQIKCYLEPKCVSLNYGPSGDGAFECELNSKTHLQVSPSDLKDRKDFIYRAIINPCESNPCPSHSVCQTGFGIHGYRCVCPDIYQGFQNQADNWQMINIDPVCFGTKGDDYGPFYIQEAGLIYTFKLVHTSGSVTCSTSEKTTTWGCSLSTYGNHNLMTVITYSNKTVLPLAEFVKGGEGKYYTYQLDGADVNSTTLVFNRLPTPLDVLAGQQFQLWYAHDLVNFSEDNNDGKTCADVFALYHSQC